MKLHRVLVVCALLAPGATASAQAALSGTWGGTLGNDSRRTAATFALKMDGTGNVSGVISGPELTPGDATGKFDAKTGALKLKVALRGDAQVINFDGTILKDTLTATTVGNPQEFTLKLVKGAPARTGTAQAPAPRNKVEPAIAAVQRSFTEVSGWVTRAAALVPPDKYTYRPTSSVRTFGQLVAHIADAYGYYCGRVAGKTVQWSDAIEKGSTDKATVAAKLKQSLDACAAVYSGADGQIGPLIENVGHTSLHYGNMITYMRMMGIVPPSS